MTNYITTEIKTKLDRRIIAWVVYNHLFGALIADELIGANYHGWRMAENESKTVRFILGE